MGILQYSGLQIPEAIQVHTQLKIHFLLPQYERPRIIILRYRKKYSSQEKTSSFDTGIVVSECNWLPLCQVYSSKDWIVFFSLLHWARFALKNWNVFFWTTDLTFLDGSIFKCGTIHISSLLEHYSIKIGLNIYMPSKITYTPIFYMKMCSTVLHEKNLQWINFWTASKGKIFFIFYILKMN